MGVLNSYQDFSSYEDPAQPASLTMNSSGRMELQGRTLQLLHEDVSLRMSASNG
jgi:hypothetical protein